MADILFVAPDLAPGGVARCVSFIVDTLPSYGLETSLFLLRRHEGEYQVDAGRVTHALPAFVQAWRFHAALPIAFWRFLRRLRHDPPGLVCSHGLLCNLMVALARLLSRERFATVAFEHNSPSSHYRRAWGKRLLIRFGYGRHDLVVGVSQGVARDLGTMFPRLRRKCRHLYNGIPLEDVVRQSGQAAPTASPAPGVCHFVSVGRLDPLKNYATLIDAAAILDDAGIAFTILGDGPERDALQRRLDSKPSRSAVTLAGHVSNPFPDLAQAYAFVTTSIRESFGNAMVEALCLGIPVIATDCPHGPAEILGGGRYGLLVPVGDAHALASAIRRLANDPEERRRLSESGPARAAQFSLDAHCRSAAALFNPLL